MAWIESCWDKPYLCISLLRWVGNFMVSVNNMIHVQTFSFTKLLFCGGKKYLLCLCPGWVSSHQALIRITHSYRVWPSCYLLLTAPSNIHCRWAGHAHTIAGNWSSAGCLVLFQIVQGERVTVHLSLTRIGRCKVTQIRCPVSPTGLAFVPSFPSLADPWATSTQPVLHFWALLLRLVAW